MLASKEVKLMLADKLIEETNNAVRKRKKERANWDGTGKKPKDYDKMGMWKLKRDLAAKLKRDYIDSCEADAEAEIVFRWMGQEEKTREVEMSWSIIGEIIDDYAAECIKETFSASVQARERAEADSGIVFSQVGLGSDLKEAEKEAEIHHETYINLLRLVNARQAELREGIAKWSIALKAAIRGEEPEETEEQRLAREA